MLRNRLARVHRYAAICWFACASYSQAQQTTIYKPIGTSVAQSSTTSAPASSTPPALSGAETLLISRGDLLALTVYGEPDQSQIVRVTDKGEIPLLMGGSVIVAGLTPEQASKAVADHLRDAHILNHPLISILVQEYATQGAAVLGEVARPGVVPITTPRRVIDVVALAGGMTAIADRHVIIQHGNNPSDRQTVFLSNSPNVSLDGNSVMVNPGDTVVVPRGGIVYVLGDVGRPGGYVMQNEGRMTILQAISIAGSTNNTAAQSHVRLIRKTDGKYVEIPVDLKVIEKGKADDMQVMADDILFVPFSIGRHIILGAGGLIPAAAAASIYQLP